MIEIKSIDRKEALRYLSCRDEKNIGETASAYLDECEKRLLEVITPKYLYKYFPLITENGIPVIEDCPLPLEGKNIAAHLEGCSGVILMCGTIGSGADRLIRILQIEDMAKAVIADAFSGAAVEQVMNEAEKQIREDFAGKYFTWRYSPGYGDFPIDLQKSLLAVLDAPRKIGLCASDSKMLVPVKSVTAVMGVSDTPLPPQKRGCVTCNMRERCQFRKRGLHCGS
ncbi:MAG: methionine synthase [Oscillospiraceae bacterium]|nr:methionine synthase [Oscillospiraceae bacterium]